MMRFAAVFLAFGLLALPARAETISELVNRGLVLLDSHAAPNGTITLILGTFEGGPQYICQTRYRISDAGDFDNCRMLK